MPSVPSVPFRQSKDKPTLPHMRILILVAGTNDPSNAEYLADLFAEGLKTVSGTDVEKVRVKDIALEHFQLAHYQGKDQGADFNRLRERILAANGLVFSTPVWNFGVPAHLKNLIDHMGVFALDTETRSRGQLKGLPCYFLFTGGAPAVAWKGLMRFTTMHVKEAMRYFCASIAGSHFEGKCTKGKGQFGLVLDQRPELPETMRRKGRNFALVTEQFLKTGRLPLAYRIIDKLYTWGQRILAKF